jgi:hypothetical protein
MSCEREKDELDRAKYALEQDQSWCELPLTEEEKLSGLLKTDEEKQEYCIYTLLPPLQERVDKAEQALRQCERENAAGEDAGRLLQAEGLVTFLRVNNLKSGFGGGRTNWIDAEVIFKLDSHPERAFGFQLRDDNNLPVRQGMLDLLRDALVHDLKVKTDYVLPVATPNHNCYALRIALSKSRVPAFDPSAHPDTLAPATG